MAGFGSSSLFAPCHSLQVHVRTPRMSSSLPHGSRRELIEWGNAIPYTRLWADAQLAAVASPDFLSHGLNSLQTTVKGAGVESVDLGFYALKIRGQVSCLVLSVCREGRIWGEAARLVGFGLIIGPICAELHGVPGISY